MKYFAIIINSANGILSDSIANKEIEYTTQNDVSVSAGDCVIGIISQPINQVRMIMEITKSSNGKKVYLKKLYDIYEGVNLSEIESIQTVVDDAEASDNDIIEIGEAIYKEAKSHLLDGFASDSNSNNSDAIELRKEEFKRFILYVLCKKSTRQVRDLEVVSEMAVESGDIPKSVYLIDDVEEYCLAREKIKSCQKYIDFKEHAKDTAKQRENNTNSGLACDQGMTNYEKFLQYYNEKSEDEVIPIDPITGYKSSEPRNRIYFGAPGTGKSFTVNSDRKKLLGEDNEDDYERVTFHPDYSYANFVGTYKPIPCKDSEGKDSITYEYVPGPFMRTLIKALKSARAGEKKPYLLIIEEINRANAAAVFGDIFQLLDRNIDNISEYSIQTSEDIKKYLAKDDVLGGTPETYAQLVIPDNMFIWATMNSADQGVFPMDTAFKRRWDFEYIGIDENEKDLIGKKVILGKESKQSVEWNELRKAINAFLSKYKINEDKQLGPYFIARNIVVPNEGDVIDPIQFAKIFKGKVIMYLFEDAAKQKKESLFSGCPENKRRYSDICSKFDEIGINIFDSEIVKASKAEPIVETQS